MSSDNAISWTVELPQKKSTALGQKRPRARLVIGETETIELPKPVGVRLKRLEKEKRSFSSRAELLYTVRELASACAHDRMEQLVNFREYSSAELKRKFLDDGYTSATADRIVSRALEVGVISDERFCETFIRSKLAQGWGSQRILRELERRGINTQDAEGLYELMPTPEEEADQAYAIASRRRLSGKNDYQKIVRYLVTRGYSVTAASNAAKRVLQEAQDQA